SPSGARVGEEPGEQVREVVDERDGAGVLHARRADDADGAEHAVAGAVVRRDDGEVGEAGFRVLVPDDDLHALVTEDALQEIDEPPLLLERLEERFRALEVAELRGADEVRGPLDEDVLPLALEGERVATERQQAGAEAIVLGALLRDLARDRLADLGER